VRQDGAVTAKPTTPTRATAAVADSVIAAPKRKPGDARFLLSDSTGGKGPIQVRKAMSKGEARAILAKLDPGSLPKGERDKISKATDADVLSSNVIDDPTIVETAHFTLAGALIPPYDFNTLADLYENSSILRPNIDAYVTNIDGFGWRLEPVIDLDKDDADDQIRDVMRAERLRMKRDPATRFSPGVAAMPVDPSDDEVSARRIEFEPLIRDEKLQLQGFFDSCNPDKSFVALRRLMREEKESMGNSYWEVVRNAVGDIAQLNYIPAFTVRMLPLDRRPVQVEVRVRGADLRYRAYTQEKNFRRYVQVFSTLVRPQATSSGARVIYFKEFGDIRTFSKKSGHNFKDVDALKLADKDDEPATEIIHFKVQNQRYPYGVPRWIGSLLAVWGNRQAEEVNFLYFDNKSIPPYMILVSGGQLTAESLGNLKDHIQANIKGRANFHKVLLLEGEAAAAATGLQGGSRMRIEAVPMTQQTDALFMKYDERNADKVGMAFRVPRLLRGDVTDVNRACYSDDTEVLTPQGWLRHDEVGDAQIAIVEKDNGAVRFERPGPLRSYWHDGDMVRLRSRSVDVLVTPEHKMLVRTKGGDWSTPPASELVGRRRTVVRAAASSFAGTAQPATFALPEDPEAQHRVDGHGHAPIPFASFVEFLGYFCSDGGLLDTDDPASSRLVFIRQKKCQTAAKMRTCLDAIGWPYSTQEKPDGTQVYTISNRCLRSWLRPRCGRGQLDRTLPQDFVGELDAGNLRILFDALMAGDGTWDARDSRASGCYYTGSSVLAAQVQAVATLLGMRSHCRWSQGGGVFRVMLSVLQTASVQDGGETVPYRGTVHCFETSTGFYVTRRNGCVAYQGNTAAAALEYFESQVAGPERDEFDFWINTRLLSAMGVRFWKFVSQGPTMRDPETLMKIAEMAIKSTAIPSFPRSQPRLGT
jgi:PBSX family phage portal protein